MYIRTFAIVLLAQLGWAPMARAGHKRDLARAVKILNRRAFDYKGSNKMVLATSKDGKQLIFVSHKDTAQILTPDERSVSVDEAALKKDFPEIQSKDDVINLLVGVAAGLKKEPPPIATLQVAP